MTSKHTLYALAFCIAVSFISLAVSGTSAEDIAALPCFSDADGGVSFAWRATYVFLHGGIFHTLANVLCLMAIARSPFYVPNLYIFVALLFAFLAPMHHDTLTIGCSGVCYALLGMMSWQSCDKRRFHLTIAAFILLGMLPFTHSNYTIHAFCYIEGVLFGRICKK